MGATPGGAQDNGLAQTQVSQGGVPKPEAFTVEGLLNQYDLPLESLPCTQDLCIDAAYGVASVLIGMSVLLIYADIVRPVRLGG